MRCYILCVGGTNFTIYLWEGERRWIFFIMVALPSKFNFQRGGTWVMPCNVWVKKKNDLASGWVNKKLWVDLEMRGRKAVRNCRRAIPATTTTRMVVSVGKLCGKTATSGNRPKFGRITKKMAGSKWWMTTMIMVTPVAIDTWMHEEVVGTNGDHNSVSNWLKFNSNSGC